MEELEGSPRDHFLDRTFCETNLLRRGLESRNSRDSTPPMYVMGIAHTIARATTLDTTEHVPPLSSEDPAMPEQG